MRSFVLSVCLPPGIVSKSGEVAKSNRAAPPYRGDVMGKEANEPKVWRVRVSGNWEPMEFETREDAEEQADLIRFADPAVEGYVWGIGWVPASNIRKG